MNCAAAEMRGSGESVIRRRGRKSGAGKSFCVKWLWRVAFGVAALIWVYCLAAHLFTVAGRPIPVIDPLLVGAVGAAITWIGVWPVRRLAWDKIVPTPKVVPVVFVISFVCGMWPMIVGSGVANTHPMAIFGNTGVPSGEPGDRYLGSHGRRVRTLTEDEYQQVVEWEKVVRSGFSAAFSGAILAYALYLRRARNTPSVALHQICAANN